MAGLSFRESACNAIGFSKRWPGGRSMPPGFSFPAPRNLRDEICVIRKAAKMKRTMQEFKRPYCESDYHLVRAGRRGTYWEAPDGRRERLAGSDAEPVVERSRVTVLT